MSSHSPGGAPPPNQRIAVRLEAAWRGLAGNTPEAVAVGAELLGRWNEPHRRYHTLTHLEATLRAVDLLRDEARDADRVRYAVWFHDAVYEGVPGRDEEESAELAERLLSLMGAEPAFVREVARLVGVTATHRPGRWDADGAVLCDADLSVLAAPADEYLAYTTAIRAEYRHVSDEEFRAGRTGVLRSLLEAPHLFHTPFGRARWEARARVNMLAELDRLDARPPEELPPP
ncbi:MULTISPECIES: HD domain-containing protein [Nocardiopsis]|uniref:Metal-dependent phosphohydrolase n=1 Tax=Nocardiopsis sinuspersici TaxID=501010 RepID=A0A1V3BXT7_9ACTN|nr:MULTISPECIES: metal-dependent phosphohydrolase [Nocardiopsis]NYH54252.1 putative metal-dependent HD superfamily phosphohydrolase [Nocardiopsis sinuspersici]OOC53069.1 metal-dependent phosphohydrolase [Nocardiopsis sinuspersici]